jgi:hypothetical protein
MPALVKGIFRSNKGQTLTELTLIFPLMLFLAYGAIEIGSVISTYLTLTQTSREAANLASRGTDPNLALDAIIAGAAPTISNSNPGQWKIIYTKIVQSPASPCPPTGPCDYEIGAQIVRGSFGQSSQIGNSVGAPVTIPGIDKVIAGQTFHAIEVFYDYTPNVVTFVGNTIPKTFYDRTIFTNVSGTS